MVAIFSGARWLADKPEGMQWLMNMAKAYKKHGADFYFNLALRGTVNQGIDLGAQFESAEAYGVFMDKLSEDADYQGLMQQAMSTDAGIIKMVNSYECTADHELGGMIDTSLPYYKVTIFAPAGPGKMESLMKSTAIAKKLQEAMGSSVSVWRGISGEPTGMVYIEGHKSMTDYGKTIDGANSSDDFTKWANDALNDPSGMIASQTLVRNMKSMI
jgi:hypothetical protein